MSYYSKQALDQPSTRQCAHVKSGICMACAWPTLLNPRFVSRQSMPMLTTESRAK